MNAKRLWSLGSIVVIIALVAGSWFLGISPRLAEASLANDERANVEQQNLMHQATLAALQKQFEGMDDLKLQVEEMNVAMPDAVNLPDLINELNRMSGNSDVVVKSLTLGIPTPYVPTVGATPPDPEFTAAMAGVKPENLLIVPLDLALSGTYGQVMAFVSSLQLGDRLFLVHDLALASGAMSNDSAVEYTVSGQLFVLTDSGTAPPSAEAPAGDSAATAPVE